MTITIEAMADLGCHVFDATNDPPTGEECPDGCTPPCCDTAPEDKYVTVSANSHSLNPSVAGSWNMPENGRFFEEWSNDCTAITPACMEAGRSPCDFQTPGPNRRQVTIPASTWNTWLGASGNLMTITVNASSAVHTAPFDERSLALYCEELGFQYCPSQSCEGLCGPETFSRVTISYTGIECADAGDCDDSNVCTDDSCVDDECVNTNNTASCSDGLYCTTNDACSNGVCTGEPSSPCDPGEACNEQSDSCEPDCNLNGAADGADIAAFSSLDCNVNSVPDECDIAAMTSVDCNVNGIADECEPPFAAIAYDASLGLLPPTADPAWPKTSPGNIDGTIENDLLVIDDDDMANRAAYSISDVFDSASQSAVYEVMGRAISASRPNGQLIVWISGLSDGSRSIELTVIIGKVGILKSDTNDFVTGCSANMTTNDALHTYRVLKIGTDRIHVFADGEHLFSCSYADLPTAAIDRALLLATSTNGKSKFELASMRYAIGTISLDGVDCNGNEILDSCDLAAGTSTDCGGDGVPDECEPDCNSNSIPDECELCWNDCNLNGVPDECDLASGTSMDINGNGVPDECEDCNTNSIPDFEEDCDSTGYAFRHDYDRDGDSDLEDFRYFQLCFNTNGVSTNGVTRDDCLCAFDWDTSGQRNEIIDLDDFATFASANSHGAGPQLACWLAGLEGQCAGGGEEMMMGGEGESMESYQAEEPPPDPWTFDVADISFELQPVGGGDPVSTLAPNTTYELHYEAGVDQVNFYVLAAVATSTSEGLTAVSAPAAGDWSDTGNFQFIDIETEYGELVPAPDYPTGYYRTHWVIDEFWPVADGYAGPQGHLCNVTTASSGELNLVLYMDWIDPDEQEIVSMEAQAAFTVE